MRHRRRHLLGIALGVALLAGTLASCATEDEGREPTRDPQAALAEAAQRQFGAGIEEGAVVARVGERAITVGELAICLEATPIRGLEGCLDDRIDAALAVAHATHEDFANRRLADARRSGQASVYLRENVEAAIRPETITAEEVEAFRALPGHRLFVEGPELRQASHLLVQEEGGPSPATGPFAARVRASLDDHEGPLFVQQLRDARAQFQDEATAAGLELRVEAHLLAHSDNDDPDAWPGLPLVSQIFAEALFALPAPGSLSEPVDSEFGTHLVLLERVWPAQALSPEEAERLLRRELVQRQRHDEAGRLLAELLEAADVVRYNAIEIFRLDDETIIQERNATIRESLGAQP